jgi:hypothetical protein
MKWKTRKEKEKVRTIGNERTRRKMKLPTTLARPALMMVRTSSWNSSPMMLAHPFPMMSPSMTSLEWISPTSPADSFLPVAARAQRMTMTGTESASLVRDCTLYKLSYGCETNMETYSANGKDETHCEYISELTNSKSKGSSSGGGGCGAGWAIFWVLFVVAILGVAGFIFYQKKGKKGKSQVCLLCYYRCLSNLLLGHHLVNTVKAAEES